MIEADDPVNTGAKPRLRSPRRLWLAWLAAAIVLFFLVCASLPWFVEAFKSAFPRTLRRNMVVGVIDGLLVTYALLLISLVLGLVILVGVVVRHRRSRWRDPSLGRLLLLDLSLLIGLTGLEVAAAAWVGWLHRDPALPRKLPAPTDGSRRILVIGESSAEGQPYHPRLSVGQIVGWQLEEVFPGRPFQVDMQAEGGATLEKVHQKLAQLSYRPDAMLLFCGQNEFQARWAWFRGPRYYAHEYRPNAWLFDLAIRLLPSCRLISETLDRRQVGAIPLHQVSRPLVDRPTFTRRERKELLADFRRRLGAIAAFFDRLGTVPIFIVPGSNDGDYEPSRSTLPANTDLQARESFAREFERRRRWSRVNRRRPSPVTRHCSKVRPDSRRHITVWGGCWRHPGRGLRQREHYEKAREYDVMPMRCPEDFRQAYRDVAREHPSIVLVESAEVLRPLSPHGILDDHVYHDAQHPTFRGYLARGAGGAGPAARASGTGLARGKTGAAD